MRSFSASTSFMGAIVDLLLAQPVAQRHTFVEHKTLAAPAALLLRHAFEIPKDPALEVTDLAKSLRQQIGAGLLASDSAGPEHRQPLVRPQRKVLPRDFLYLPKAVETGIDRPLS